MERWIDIPGYVDYEVSDHGHVRSKARPSHNGRGAYTRQQCVLSQFTTKKGYRAVGLYRDGGRTWRRWLVHRLVMLAFIGDDSRQVRHRNGDPADNRLENLEYGTNAENQTDSVAHGTHHMARKTHCKRGHEFTEENTYHYTRRDGGSGRSCRACRRKS